VELLLKLIKLF